jgi:hypothetical protein
MATTDVSKSLEKKAVESLGPLAKQLQKTAGSLWEIFVRRYIAIGVSQAFAGTLAPAYGLWQFSDNVPILTGFFVIGAVLWYSALQNLINPHYLAMEDVIKHVKQATKPEPNELVVKGPPRTDTYIPF